MGRKKRRNKTSAGGNVWTEGGAVSITPGTTSLPAGCPIPKYIRRTSGGDGERRAEVGGCSKAASEGAWALLIHGMTGKGLGDILIEREGNGQEPPQDPDVPISTSHTSSQLLSTMQVIGY